MEHRLSQRIAGELPILVYKRGMPVATGRIQDASHRGLFVATEFNDIRLNQVIELAFRYPEQLGHGHRLLSAHVVRRDKHGLGLDFDGVDNDALAVAELIHWLQHQDLLMLDSVNQKQSH